MTQISLYDWLLLRFNSNTNNTSVNTLNNKEYKLFYELISSAIRVNYNQKSTVINALAGAIGLIPLVDSSIWAVKEGNYRVVYDMINLLTGNVYTKHRVNSVTYNRHNSDPYTIEGTRVSDISRKPTPATCISNSDNNSNNTDSETCTTAVGDENANTHSFNTDNKDDDNDGKFKAVYDIVIICTPLENANISFTITQSSIYHNSEDPSVQQPAFVQEYYPRMYQSTYATFLQGHLLNTSSLYLAASSNNTLATYLPAWLRPLIRWLGWLHPDSDTIQLPGTLLTVEPPTETDTDSRKGQNYDGYISSIGSYYTDPSSTSSDNNGTIYKLFSRTLIPISALSTMFNIIDNTPIISTSGGSSSSSSVSGDDFSGLSAHNSTNSASCTSSDRSSASSSASSRSVVIKNWAAYPVFNPPELFTPFELTLTTTTTIIDKQQQQELLSHTSDGDSNKTSTNSTTTTDSNKVSEGESNKGLYYTNTFENAFSCLEGQAVAGRNTAGLVWEYILEREGSEL